MNCNITLHYKHMSSLEEQYLKNIDTEYNSALKDNYIAFIELINNTLNFIKELEKKHSNDLSISATVTDIDKYIQINSQMETLRKSLSQVLNNLTPLTLPTILNIIKNVGIHKEIIASKKKLHISKTTWDNFGSIIVKQEHLLQNIDTNTTWTIRLDGKNFSPLVKCLRRNGVFSEGYSHEFGNAMLETANVIMKTINSLCVFIQSDEMTFIVASTSIDQTVYYNGRIMKIASTIASLASQTFLRCIYKLAKNKNVELPENPITFDARIGHWSSIEEAFTLLLWRSEDCSVNGISDAIHHAKAGKIIKESHTNDKLQYLIDNNLYPLIPHQEYGTLLWVVKEPKNCLNQKTGETSIKTGRVIKSLNTYLPYLFNQKNILFNESGKLITIQ